MATETNPEPRVSIPPECDGVPLFEPGDGDTHISVNGTRFETHKFLIKRFRGLRVLLDKQPLEITIQRNDVSAEDFREMFKVLYASVVTGPFEFAPNTLISTLRVATLYEHEALRDYCIKHLEKLELDAVKRIELAHELHISAWEKPAYDELARRDTLITREEAKIIGFDAFLSIIEMREKEQQRRLKEMNAVDGEQGGESAVPLNEEDSALADIAGGSQEHAPHPSHTGPHNDGKEPDDRVIHIDEAGAVPLFAGMELSGLAGWKTKHGYMVEIPTCTCRFTDQDGLEQPGRACLISPCVISALKSIQTQQQAQANSLSNRLMFSGGGFHSGRLGRTF
ncbi:unnamed protein product [Rhizoctonia solani]|uniref:BTB domain-containing protein n=1 Tax=Rhizoctonia solani TaxID=456999 RepID=A0A8H3GZB3_9AGAM|nr:unnamed protein product [Rhizoctonia solani]